MENQPQDQPQDQPAPVLPPPDPNRPLYFTIKYAHAEVMIKAVAKLPYEQVHEFIHDLQTQYGQQILLAQEPTPMSAPPTHVAGKPFLNMDEISEDIEKIKNCEDTDSESEPTYEEELTCAPAPPGEDKA